MINAAPPDETEAGLPMSAKEIKKLLEDAQAQGVIRAAELQVIWELSSQLGKKTKKQVAELIGRDTWAVYNIRRSGLRKLAKLLEIEDEEQLFPVLGLRRGHRLPKRTTRYFPKKEQDHVEDVGDIFMSLNIEGYQDMDLDEPI